MGRLSLEERAAVHAALGDTSRLAIVDALALSDRSPHELERTLQLRSNLLAHHLDVLEAADVVERIASSGDRRRKYVRLRRNIVDDLGLQPSMPRGRVLFVCTHNSARSQLAAAIWNRAADGEAESAGTHPAARVHPKAIAAAARHGLDLGGGQPRSLADVRGGYEIVVTVCDRAHEELPSTGGLALHWSILDPAEANTMRAFETAYAAIEERVTSLAPLNDERYEPTRGRQ